MGVCGGWILNPCLTWVNMNYLNRKSGLSLRWLSGNPHCGLGKEKERGHFQSQGNQNGGTSCII